MTVILGREEYRMQSMTKVLIPLIILGGLIFTGCGGANGPEVIQPTFNYKPTEQERKTAEQAAAVGKERKAALINQ